MNDPRTGHDSIFIHNLSLPNSVLAPNAWGDVKPQPALLSAKLQLQTGFGSAANVDRLDSSTVHYGTLAKLIRAECCQDLPFEQVLERGFASIERLARNVLTKCELRLCLPKASLLGESVNIVETKAFQSDTKCARVLEVVGVRVPVLVGVNAYERTMKQPVILNLTLEFDNMNDCGKLFALEKIMVQAVQETSFETLESLAEFTVQQLEAKVLGSQLSCGMLTLSIMKPMAIAFAEAPGVEVVRRMPHVDGTAHSKIDAAVATRSSGTSVVSTLLICKPYLDR